MSRLLAALQETVEGDYQVMVRLDSDDVTAAQYPRTNRTTYAQGARIGFSGSLNELAKDAYRLGYSHVALFGDDVLPSTKGWDLKLIASLRNRVGVAYGSDGLESKHGADLPTHVVLPIEIFERLGWVALPQVRHLFSDNVWRELGQGVGNFQYLPDVKLTHLHPWADKARMDVTYKAANDAKQRKVDKIAFDMWVSSGQRDIHVEMLKAGRVE